VSALKIAIIGGAGKMGQWLARYLIQEGHRVTLIDRQAAALPAACRALQADAAGIQTAGEADSIIIAVPIDAFEGVVQELSGYVHPEQRVMDITSVKCMPVEVMHRLLPSCRILGTHPVFGPGAAGLQGHNVVLTPVTENEERLASQVRAYLENRGARVAVMSPEKHDRMMAVVLGLAHYIAIVAGDTLLGLEDLKEMEQVGGVTFKALLTLVTSVLSEDPALYASIQMHLPLEALEAGFQQQAADWADTVKRHDRQGFISRMSALHQKLEQLNLDSNQAYRNLYRLVDSPAD
jgi:prephenate dehydrogenase